MAVWCVLNMISYDIRWDVIRNTGHEEYDIRRSTSLCYVPLFSDSLVWQLTISDVMPGGIPVSRNMMSDVIQRGSLVTKLSLEGRRGQRFKKRGIIIHKR